MKRLYTSILLLISFLVSFGQAQPPFQILGNSGNEVKILGIGSAHKGFALRLSYPDTISANNDLYLKNIRGIQIRQADTIWQRSNDLSRWFRAGGGSVYVDTSNTITLSGNGSDGNPLTADAIVSTEQGNALQATGVGLFVPNYIQDGIKQPGVITWIQNYDYDVSPAIGVIGGVEYTSVWTPITLATADPTYDRIDLVVFNAGVGSSVGTITVITGTPSDDPQQPVLADPTTQLVMSFILVTANTTEPPVPPTQDWIYYNYLTNSWTTVSSTPRIVVNSSVNPYSAPLDVEGTLALNTDNVRFTAITPPTISNFNILTFKIRSKAVWVSNSRIGLQWYNASAIATGVEVPVSSGTFGFNSSQILTYQIISINLSQFGALLDPTNLLITVRTTGGRSIGFYIDDIQLQDGLVSNLGYTGSNGVVLTGQNFEVGGSLIKHTTLSAGPYTLAITGQTGSLSTVPFTVTANNNGAAILGTSRSVFGGVTGVNSLAIGPALKGQNNNVVTNTVAPGLTVERITTGGSVAAGMGVSIDFNITTTDNPSQSSVRSNRFISKWITPTTGAVTSEFILTGVSNAVESDMLTMSGSGAFKFNKYTTNAFTGTPVNILATDASGNVIQTSISPGGFFSPDQTSTGNTLHNAAGFDFRLENIDLLRLIAVGNMELYGDQASFGALDDVTLYAEGGNLHLESRADSMLIELTDHGKINIDTLRRSSDSTNKKPMYWDQVTGEWGAFNYWPASAAGAVYTASSGLSMSGNNVKLGGTLTANTTIATGAFTLALTTSTAVINPLSVTSTTGSAIVASTTSGKGVSSTSASGYALYGNSTNTVAIYGETTNGLGGQFVRTNSNTNTVNAILSLENYTTGTAAAGLGGKVNLNIETTTGDVQLANELIWKWTTATDASRVSQFIVTGVDNAVTADLLTLSGSGAFRLNNYGVNTFAGVAAYVLAVDASGNVVEVAAAGAGMTNVLTTNGDMIYGVGSTPTRLPIGTAGQVLTVNAGATAPEWTTVVGTGSVTNVSWTGGIVSIANPTTTPAFTIAGTSGGIPYFSGAATWASSAALAANAIMIGGGAGAAPSTTTTGTGVLTALGINVGSAGAFVTFNGALGTPSSGVGTNLTGTATALNIGGNAATATILQNTRTINGVSFNGSANITVTADANTLTNTNLSGSVITSSLVAVGTINTGAWEGTTIASDFGGTGFTTYAAGDLIYASAINTLSKLPVSTNGFVLQLSGGLPVWAAAGAGTITAVNGTTNQVIANTVGTVVTLSLPQNIHTTAIPQFLGLNLVGNGTYSNGLSVTGTINGPAFTTNFTSVGSIGSDVSFMTLSGAINEAASGVHALLSAANINAPSVTPGAATVTNTATLAINGAMSATVTGGNYALYVISGDTRLGSLAGTGNRYTQADANGVVSATHGIFNPTEQVITDGATLNWNVANGGNGVVMLSGTGRTFANPTNLIPGYTYTFRIIQGSGGSKTISTWTNVSWSNNTDPTLSTTAGAIDVVRLYCVTTTNLYGTFTPNMQ